MSFAIFNKWVDTMLVAQPLCAGHVSTRARGRGRGSGG